MEIDTKKIEELYGRDVIIEIQENMDDVILNLEYLVSKGFSNALEILNSYPYIFLEDNEMFKIKIDDFTNKLGVSYIEILEDDMSLWGDLL